MRSNATVKRCFTTKYVSPDGVPKHIVDTPVGVSGSEKMVFLLMEVIMCLLLEVRVGSFVLQVQNERLQWYSRKLRRGNISWCACFGNGKERPFCKICVQKTALTTMIRLHCPWAAEWRTRIDKCGFRFRRWRTFHSEWSGNGAGVVGCFERRNHEIGKTWRDCRGRKFKKWWMPGKLDPYLKTWLNSE